MPSSTEPQLAPPGAGLPKIELLIGRLLFALRRWTGNRASFDAKFRKEREAIAALVRSCGAEVAAQRVLIKRLPGLEDSSRYWSVWMTLDHLHIVNHQLARVIGTLSQGRMPEGKASTAAVKPSADVNAAVIAAYEGSCDMLLAAVAGAPNLKTSVRFDHPWFGPLDAHGWYALAGAHMGIHRGQITRILAGMNRQ